MGGHRLGNLLGNLLFGSRFMTIWLATGLLLGVCRLVASDTLSVASWSVMLPLGTVVAMAALGQMLVVMTGGIDLSMAASISLLANVLVGSAAGSDNRLGYAVGVVLIWAVIVGLVNGTLVAVVRLNPLIVTLATGLILLGVTEEYRLGTANEASVPSALSDWVFSRALGVSWVFWLGLIYAGMVSLLLRSTRAGRRFQSVGANPRAAWLAGINVRGHVVFAYVASAVSAGVAAVVIGGIVDSPGIDPGAPYLLGPIAAVVLGGASLAGGLASPMSTWIAAFALTILNQMLRVLGLSTALQFIVFGVAIAVGMLISGDRIASVLGRLLQRPSMQSLIARDPAENFE